MSKVKWSYKTVHFELKREGLLGGSFLDEAEIEERLNDFGHSGWELISVIEVQDGIIAFFKQSLDLGLSSVAQEDIGSESDEIQKAGYAYQASRVQGTDDQYQTDEAEEIYDPYASEDTLEVDDVYDDGIYEADDSASAESETYEQDYSHREEEEFVDREDRGYQTSLSEDDLDTFVEEAQEEHENQEAGDEQQENDSDRGIGAIRIE
jgi:hypothetical protein